MIYSWMVELTPQLREYLQEAHAECAMAGVRHGREDAAGEFASTCILRCCGALQCVGCASTLRTDHVWMELALQRHIHVGGGHVPPDWLVAVLVHLLVLARPMRPSFAFHARPNIPAHVTKSRIRTLRTSMTCQAALQRPLYILARCRCALICAHYRCSPQGAAYSPSQRVIHSCMVGLTPQPVRIPAGDPCGVLKELATGLGRLFRNSLCFPLPRQALTLARTAQTAAGATAWRSWERFMLPRARIQCHKLELGQW